MSRISGTMMDKTRAKPVVAGARGGFVERGQRAIRRLLGYAAQTARFEAHGCCDVCGFQESDDHLVAWESGNDQRVTCSECLPSVAPTLAEGSFSVAWMPELSQADVSHLCRVIAYMTWKGIEIKRASATARFKASNEKAEEDDAAKRHECSLPPGLADAVSHMPSGTSSKLGLDVDDGITMDFLGTLMAEDGDEDESPAPVSPALDEAAARAAYAAMKGRIELAKTIFGHSDLAHILFVLADMPEDVRAKAVDCIRFVPSEIPVERIRSWTVTGSFRDVAETGGIAA